MYTTKEKWIMKGGKEKGCGTYTPVFNGDSVTGSILPLKCGRKMDQLMGDNKKTKKELSTRPMIISITKSC